MSCPHVPVSWGELLDKITILEIKCERLDDPIGRANVSHERRVLRDRADPALRIEGVSAAVGRLRAINAQLWEIEDSIRAKEHAQDFGAEFIRLARAVYQRNDERAAIKREINALLGSELIEEKSYWTAQAEGRATGGAPDRRARAA